MQNEPHAVEPIDWRRFVEWDAKSAAVTLGCALFLICLLVILPRWLQSREQTDFAGTHVQSAPGEVTALQISPVSVGGGSLFNAVNLDFAGYKAFYALPSGSRWKPRFHQDVIVSFHVGRRSKAVRIDSVVPN